MAWATQRKSWHTLSRLGTGLGLTFLPNAAFAGMGRGKLIAPWRQPRSDGNARIVYAGLRLRLSTFTKSTGLSRIRKSLRKAGRRWRSCNVKERCAGLEFPISMSSRWIAHRPSLPSPLCSRAIRWCIPKWSRKYSHFATLRESA